MFELQSASAYAHQFTAYDRQALSDRSELREACKQWSSVSENICTLTNTTPDISRVVLYADEICSRADAARESLRQDAVT